MSDPKPRRQSITINLNEINENKEIPLSKFTPSSTKNKKPFKRMEINSKVIGNIKTSKVDLQIKILDTFISLLIFSNLTFNFIDNNLTVSEEGLPTDSDYKPMNQVNDKINYLRIFNCIIVIITEVLLIVTYYLKLSKLRIEGLASSNDGIYSTGLFKFLILEVIVLLPVCPPYIEIIIKGKMLGSIYVYSISTITTSISLLKIYYIVKIFNHYSIFTSFYAKTVSKKKKREADFSFSFKAYLNHYPILSVSVLYFLTAVILTCILRASEYGYNPDISSYDKQNKAISNKSLKSYFDVIWLTLISMTTVGYGDLFPYTHIGRILMFIGATIGTFLVSMMISFFSNHVEFDPEQRKAYSMILKLESIKKMKVKASDGIKVFLLFYLTNKRKYKSNKEKMIRLYKALNLLSFVTKSFSLNFKSVQNFFLPSDKVLSNLDKNLTDQVKVIQYSSEVINYVREKLVKINHEEKKILVSFENIEDLLDSIGEFMVKVNKDV